MSKGMTISGGMTTSARQGNGIWFDHEALAAMATDKPEAPYVIDHNMDISAVAGFVKNVKAERFDIEVPIVKQESKKDGGESAPAVVKEKATRLKHVSNLQPSFAAYDQAQKHIAAVRGAGKIPQESIALQATAISYEPATDRLFLDGPYMLVHHSLVSKGAFGPEDGVGIFDMAEEGPEMRFGTVIETSAEGESEGSLMKAGPVMVTNLPDLVAAFAIKNANNYAAMKAAMRAGLRIETGDEDSDAQDDAPDTDAAASRGVSNTASAPSPTQGETLSPPGATSMPDSPPSPPAGAGTTPAPPSQAELEALVSAAVDKRMAAAEAQRNAAALAAKRQTLVDTYGVEETIVNAMDASALTAFESHLRNSESQGLARRAPKKGSPNEAHYAALDAGRKSFIERVALVKPEA